jgi:formylglycine-generating enzyme required for sulfatase activity
MIRDARAAQPEPFTNSIGMHMRPIPAGSFEMGQARGGDFDERPVHRVRIRCPFWMAETEVTNAQYERFDPSHRDLRGKLGFSTADDEAVVFVSWHEAARFCAWLAEKEGKPYRLPTEAEWEYACRAGTATPYHTGDSLPKAFHKNARQSWYPGRGGKDHVVPLTVGRTPPNTWGLIDMHGNVEEWCADWYGPYVAAAQTDPVGRASGDYKVTRGGSHSTTLAYLRSANRAGTLPADRSWVIGFRVACGQPPDTDPLPPPEPPRWATDVSQKVPADLGDGPDPDEPFFRGPRTYVKIPPGSDGPLFARHNHCPALVNCPNGDLLAIWYTCRSEPGRELDIAASRLRYGSDAWESAAPFWGAPDRNDHASALWADRDGTLYHFNGLSAHATWGSLATVMRTSTDSGATWSEARLIMPEHGPHHMPVETVIRLRDGTILVPCDAVPGGSGGTAVLVSPDGGRTWTDPAEGKPIPNFKEGSTGHTIAGIHAGIVELEDGRLMAFGRGNNIRGRMPMSLSRDGGRTWTYHASPWDPIGGGQRLVVLRLAEGPILFCSFARKMTIEDATGTERPISGLFAALSTDEGRTWPVRKLISDYGPPRRVDGGGNTGTFTMSASQGEPRGYLSICQTPDRVIHLISSKQHYRFNLAWLREPMPAGPKPPEAKDLSAKPRLEYTYVPDGLPSKDAAWRWTGSGADEAKQVTVREGGGLVIDTAGGARCRWAADTPDGWGRVDPTKGFTFEVRMRVTKSTSATRGVDVEALVSDADGGPRRYFLTVTRTAVLWNDGHGFEALADDLDNAAAAHTYRLAVRPDGLVQVYRDAKRVGVRRPAAVRDPMIGTDRPYVQFGEGAGGSEADVVVEHVAWDLAGPFAPER